jgi:hypothetical protein
VQATLGVLIRNQGSDEFICGMLEAEAPNRLRECHRACKNQGQVLASCTQCRDGKQDRTALTQAVGTTRLAPHTDVGTSTGG